MTTIPAWRTSTYSGENGNCVQVAPLDTAVGVRDSKNPNAGHLTFPPDAFAAFLDTVKSGRLDLRA